MASGEAKVVVRIEERPGGRVAWVTLDHRAKLNSLTSDLMDRLATAFRELAADGALRMAVLTGAGEKSFMGGANLDELRALDLVCDRAGRLRLTERGILFADEVFLRFVEAVDTPAEARLA